MDLQKLYPWNWFKHEEGGGSSAVPVRHGDVLPVNRGQGMRDLQPLMQLHHRMDRLFNEVLSGFGFPSLVGSGDIDRLFQSPAFQATVNVASDAHNYHISVEAPGLSENEVALELGDGVLSITGEKRQDSETRDRHYYRVERRYGSFRRVLSLPDDSDVDASGRH